MTDSTMTERLRVAVSALWHQLCETYPEEVADAQALIALDPELAGMRVVWSDADDRLDVTWTGRYVGSIDGAYLRGECHS